MNIDNKNEDEYFEIKKIKVDEFERKVKNQKAFLLRNDLMFAFFSILTSTVFGIKGYNPFLAFAQLFTFPLSLVLYGNIKSLLLLKKNRLEHLEELRKIDEKIEVVNEGKKLWLKLEMNLKLKET